MKCRQLIFHAKSDAVDSILATITDEVVPGFIEIPHFLGYVVMLAENYQGHEVEDRRQVTVMSFWHTGLEGSDAAAGRFISEVNRVAGTNPSRQRFDLIKAMWRASDGQELAEFP